MTDITSLYMKEVELEELKAGNKAGLLVYGTAGQECSNAEVVRAHSECCHE